MTDYEVAGVSGVSGDTKRAGESSCPQKSPRTGGDGSKEKAEAPSLGPRPVLYGETVEVAVAVAVVLSRVVFGVVFSGGGVGGVRSVCSGGRAAGEPSLLGRYTR